MGEKGGIGESVFYSAHWVDSYDEASLGNTGLAYVKR